MTEIPEHLLKRSKSAKSKATGEEDADSPDVAAKTTAVESAAKTTPAAPAKEFPNLDSEPEPSKPEPKYITAAKIRKRVPVWVLPVIAALPIWAFSFAGTMQQPPKEDVVAIESTEFYGSKGCSGCHGGSGAGGSGYALSDGEVLQTFENPVDMMVHIARGSAAIAGEEYGNERADGSRRVAGDRGVMPAQIGQISLIELELIVYHERHTLSGEEIDSEEYEAWIESMTLHWEEGGSEDPPMTEEDLELLLACADPEVTPEATGEGAPDGKVCPGPQSASEEG